MAELKTLSLRKPLSVIQEAKLYQAIGTLLGQEKKHRKVDKRKAKAFKKTHLRNAVV